MGHTGSQRKKTPIRQCYLSMLLERYKGVSPCENVLSGQSSLSVVEGCSLKRGVFSKGLGNFVNFSELSIA